MATRRVAVTGASSPVGDFLLARLAGEDRSIIAISHDLRRLGLNKEAQKSGIEWRIVDLRVALAQEFQADALLHLAPLWLLPDRIGEFAERGVRRIVALGSTSAYTKKDSPIPAELAMAKSLEQAEADVATSCARHAITWTILRPTLIYAAGRDANVSAIAAFIRRFGFFPVAAAASGLRAPIHADDVALACAAALESEAAANRSYNIGGGEVLTYRAMVVRVFNGMGKPARVLRVPAQLMLILSRAAALAGIPGINAELVRRMNRDQVFDMSDAVRDLKFAPRKFRVFF